MKGKTSIAIRATKLEATLVRRTVRRQTSWNLEALSDADLEALLPLAEKRAAGDAAGTEPVWTTEEITLLDRLWAKQAGGAG